MTRRAHIATWIGSLFIVGALVMPLTHYVWMATSGHFGTGAGHTGMSQSSEMDVYGPTLASRHGDACDYADLFASFASKPPQSDEGNVLPAQRVEHVTSPDTESGSNHRFLPPLRGPPVV